MAKTAKKPVKAAKKVNHLQSVDNNFGVLSSEVANMQIDFEKFKDGTVAAGRRMRKSLQAIKKAAQAMRISIQEHINQSKA